MKKRTLLGLGVAATAAAAAAAVAASVVKSQLPRWRRVSELVPSELMSPLLFVPGSITSDRVLRIVRALPVPARVRDDVHHEVHDAVVEGRDTVAVHLYQPRSRDKPSGLLYWIHGGGFVMGTPAMGHEFCSRVAAELGVLVVSVDYRLAPEHTFPVPLEDTYTGLRWVHDHTSELGVDAARIAVGGDSAGGGLAACLVQLAHDRGEVGVGFQLLVYPMLDDRTVLRDEHDGTGDFVWTPPANRFGWTSFLGHAPQVDTAPAYAAGARHEDLAGLPPAWIGVGDLDLFFAEDVAYAERLRSAGVRSGARRRRGHVPRCGRCRSEGGEHGRLQRRQGRRAAVRDRLTGPAHASGSIRPQRRCRRTRWQTRSMPTGSRPSTSVPHRGRPWRSPGARRRSLSVPCLRSPMLSPVSPFST